MNRQTLKIIHIIAGISGFLFILSFGSSTVIAELFLSQAAVAAVKQYCVRLYCIYPCNGSNRHYR
ncbi:hypothetical protein [Neisseria iguanae]|uniref:hypothetical protein n=1 Tax=Neisseria iguanae TaxID=90242 RepID=UPI001FE39209|nr:hypothetical protein [Neisseria iguanae]